MNIFWKELRDYRKPFIVWSLSIGILLFSSMVKYDTLTKGGLEISKMVEAFPATIQAIFGMNGLDIGTVSGYYGVNVLFVMLMLAVQAGLMGAQLVAKEEVDKTSEFLHVKPRSRTRILSEKILAGLTIVVLLAVVTVVLSFMALMQFIAPQEIAHTLLLFGGAYAMVQLVFYGLGVCFGAALSVPKHAAKLIALNVFASYLLYVLINIQPAFDWAKPLTPFMYFDARDVLAQGALSAGYTILAGAIIVGSVLFAYARYTLRDLKT